MQPLTWKEGVAGHGVVALVHDGETKRHAHIPASLKIRPLVIDYATKYADAVPRVIKLWSYGTYRGTWTIARTQEGVEIK